MEKFYSNVLKKNIMQVSKTRAKKMYENGERIYLHPCRMTFDNVWQPPLPYKKGELTEERNFDQIFNAYVYYNCDAVRGRYPHYFIEC